MGVVLGRQSPGRPGRGGPAWGQTVVKPKNLKGTLRRLVKYVATEKKGIAAVFLFVAAAAALSLVTPVLIGEAVDAVSGGVVESSSALLTILLPLALAYVAQALITFGQQFMMAGVSQRIVLRLRAGMFDKLQKLPLSFFDTHERGELMSRVTNDIDNISQTISDSTAQLMNIAVTVIGTLVMMLALSPALAAVVVIFTPLMLLLTRTITRKTRPLFRKQQSVLGRLNGEIEESISGILTVKAFGREKRMTEQFDATNREFRDTAFKALVISGLMMPLMAVINNLVYCAVSVTGAMLAVNGLITLGTITSFTVYARQFGRPLTEVANIYNTLQTAVAGAERVFEIIDSAEEPPDAADAVPLPPDTPGEVEFRDVGFGYIKGVPVIRHVSFKVPPGGTIAVVGPTGAGKTTIISLLARFYDVDEGVILVDGRDLRRYTLASVRSSFGVVLQETYLFNGTIRENIRYGRPAATDAEVESAAATANADGFIRRLPDGYDTVLNESGSILSGGEKQLVAIARAVLADAPMLILDEATSSVDTRTEQGIQRAMLSLMRGRTTFIIAHRLSTIRNADQIMVISGGGVAERGTHDELIALNGIYAKMSEAGKVKGSERAVKSEE